MAGLSALQGNWFHRLPFLLPRNGVLDNYGYQKNLLNSQIKNMHIHEYYHGNQDSQVLSSAERE